MTGTAVEPEGYSWRLCLIGGCAYENGRCFNCGREKGLTITVYTKPKCQPCRATIRFLDEHGIEYETKDTTDPAHLAEAKALGYMGAPVVVVVPAPGESVSHWYGFRPDLLGVAAEAMGKTEKLREAA